MPEIQVFPMTSDYLASGQSIGDFFTSDLVTASRHRPIAGRFNFKKQGVTAPPGSILLFQYNAHLVAHAKFISKNPPDTDSPLDSKGFFMLDLATLKYYIRPISAVDLQGFWPGLAFDQRKRKLDVGQLPAFLAFTSTR